MCAALAAAAVGANASIRTVLYDGRYAPWRDGAPSHPGVTTHPFGDCPFRCALVDTAAGPADSHSSADAVIWNAFFLWNPAAYDAPPPKPSGAIWFFADYFEEMEYGRQWTGVPALAADRNPLSASRSRRKPTEFVEEFRVSRLELTDFVVASDSPLVLDFSVVQPRMFVGCAS